MRSPEVASRIAQEAMARRFGLHRFDITARPLWTIVGPEDCDPGDVAIRIEFHGHQCDGIMLASEADWSGYADVMAARFDGARTK